jgi:hypothetical protein
MSEVWKRFDGSGSELLLALALADFANDAGASIYPSVETLSLKTRQSGRTVQRQLRRFTQIGFLEVVFESYGGRGVPTRYRIAPGWLAGGELLNGDRLSPLAARPAD